MSDEPTSAWQVRRERVRTLARAAPIFQADGGPDMAKVQALAAEADVEIRGPPLPPD